MLELWKKNLENKKIDIFKYLCFNIYMIIFINYINMCIQKYKQTLANMDEEARKREYSALSRLPYTDEIRYKIMLLLWFNK